MNQTPGTIDSGQASERQMKLPLTGGCLCGQVRFAVRQEPQNPHTCSCEMCRRHTGALTAVWVDCAVDTIEWTGPAGAPSVYRSSSISSRAFCAACGSTLGAIDDEPNVALLTGAFDEPHLVGLKPLSDSYVSRRPKWWQPKID